MENNNFDIRRYLAANTKSIKDYFIVLRSNLLLLTIVALIVTMAISIYAIFSPNIYKSSVDLKITSQKQNVLASEPLPIIGSSINDRFIANEIEIIKNYDSRERYAIALRDSFKNAQDKSRFNLLLSDTSPNSPKSLHQIIDLLDKAINVEQLNGLDIIEVSAESPSPYESALIANVCAEQYKRINLESNRGQLTVIREFLEKQRNEKSAELKQSEDELKDFQQRGKIVALDAQSNVLITQLSNLDAQRDAAKVDLMTSNEVLKQYKREIAQQDPQLADFLESQASQAYIDALQKQIAELQMNKDLALSKKNSNIDVTGKINEYDTKISDLKHKLNSVINDIKAGAYSSSPEQIRELTQKLVEEKVNNNGLLIRYNELQNIIDSYENRFNSLPKTSIELAQYQRKRESMQQLYLLIEQKYQEALINELSQPGNVMIVSKGRIPEKPSSPNRLLICVLGLIGGLGFGTGFVLIKDYFNDKIQTPEDIEEQDVNLLAWVPFLKNAGADYYRQHELGSPGEVDSVLKESFKSLRVRIQFSKANEKVPLKTILVTSSAAEEGKTLVSVNLAASYKRANLKTLLIDCDLIKPRIHSVMGVKRNPGLSDYLLRKASLNDILNKCSVNELDYITAGTAIKNTDRLMDSEGMRNFLEEVKTLYDIIILDSAPIIPVIDTQYLARYVDSTILVVCSGKTETALMKDTLNLIEKDKLPLLGTVLNNFKYKNGHKYYFKYYYNYSSQAHQKKNNGKLTEEINN